MRILVTNDDGINAPGLAVAEAIAAEIAGPDGEVWTVAPAFEQSGVAHMISYTHPTMLTQFGPRRFAAEGSPADCVMGAVHEIMRDALPDLVLSGVNRGNNAGENAVYSGTVGAAMEGALQGLPAIALSQFLGPALQDAEDPFGAARAFGVELVRRILAADREEERDEEGLYRTFYNVNFPPVPAEDVKGTRVVPQGRRGAVRFAVEAQTSPTGRTFLWARGGMQQISAEPGSDVAANLEGYISVTPMKADLTDRDGLADFADRMT